MKPARLLSQKIRDRETPEAMQRTARFVDGELSTGSGYRFAPGCSKTLLATCFGVLVHEMLGTLAGMPQERRDALCAEIRSHQLEDGTFRDPLHTDAVVQRLRKFTPTYVIWQETYFSLHALEALGRAPDHELGFVKPFLKDAALMPWLDTLGFDDFWFTSNYLMFVLYFFVKTQGRESEAAHRLLDWLDGRQDPKTGFWGTQQGASLFNGLAGAFHVYGFHQYLGREVHHAEAALASTIALQQKSGLWSEPGGGPCEDLDAIDVLAKLPAGGSALDRRVRDSLERALPALRAARLPSGGYCWTSPQRRSRPRVVLYSGLDTLKVRSDQPDLWSIWFRPLAIALAELRLGRTPGWPVQFRATPLLGWHPTPARS
jgi:hypothetical protein